MDGPRSRETKGSSFLPSTSNFIQSRRSYGHRTSELREQQDVSSNNSQTVHPNRNLIGFASPFMNIAVILRPNSIRFRSTVPGISDQSERSITFRLITSKPRKLAHFRLAPPPLYQALPFQWSCHKPDSASSLPLYANERFVKRQISPETKGKDHSVAAERIGLPRRLTRSRTPVP